jgi:hypothetical protein
MTCFSLILVSASHWGGGGGARRRGGRAGGAGQSSRTPPSSSTPLQPGLLGVLEHPPPRLVGAEKVTRTHSPRITR